MNSSLMPRIRTMALLRAVGRRIASESEQVLAWEDACQKERARRLERAELEAANRIRDAVAALSQPRYDEWNAIVRTFRPEVVELVDTNECLNDVPQEYRKHVADTMKWDFLHALVEDAYSDLNPPDFYRTLLSLYERGHFPCDWIGEYPAGHIVFY